MSVPNEPSAMNLDGESLHTGDDDRIDAVTGIRAAVEELLDGGETDWRDALRDVLDECDVLDKLLIADIAREREAHVARPAPQIDAIMREFCGWLSADIPELHSVEVPRLADSLDRFLSLRPTPPAATRHPRSKTMPSIKQLLEAILADKSAYQWHTAIQNTLTLNPEAQASRHAPPLDWQPIATAPKDGRAVLLCWAIDADGKPIDYLENPQTSGVFVQVASWRSEETGWWVYISTPSDVCLHFKPTHWMPLPAPPADAAPTEPK